MVTHSYFTHNYLDRAWPVVAFEYDPEATDVLAEKPELMLQCIYLVKESSII